MEIKELCPTITKIVNNPYQHYGKEIAKKEKEK